MGGFIDTPKLPSKLHWYLVTESEETVTEREYETEMSNVSASVFCNISFCHYCLPDQWRQTEVIMWVNMWQ